MSNFQTFGAVNGGLGGSAPQVYLAVTSDSLSTITAPGYLDDLGEAGFLKMNDWVFVNYADASAFPLNTGESSQGALMKVTYIGGMWSLQVSGAPLVASATVTAAEFIAMYTTPKLIVPAPGAGLLIVVDRAELFLDWNSVQFTGGGAISLTYGSVPAAASRLATSTVAAASVTGATADSTGLMNGSTTFLANATAANAGLYLSNDTAVFAAGNSTFEVNVHYHLIRV